MSSSSGSKKSMDDVLSSIRRIVGTEQEGQGTPQQGGGEAPLRLGDPVSGPTRSGGGGGALPLTPDMRADPGQGGGGASAPLSLSGMEADRVAAEPEPEPETPAAAAVSEEEDAVMIDEAALEDMVRRIVREELARALSEDADADSRIRAILRDELMGETGQTISENV